MRHNVGLLNLIHCKINEYNYMYVLYLLRLSVLLSKMGMSLDLFNFTDIPVAIGYHQRLHWDAPYDVRYFLVVCLLSCCAVGAIKSHYVFTNKSTTYVLCKVCKWAE